MQDMNFFNYLRQQISTNFILKYLHHGRNDNVLQRIKEWQRDHLNIVDIPGPIHYQLRLALSARGLKHYAFYRTLIRLYFLLNVEKENIFRFSHKICVKHISHACVWDVFN